VARNTSKTAVTILCAQSLHKLGSPLLGTVRLNQLADFLGFTLLLMGYADGGIAPSNISPLGPLPPARHHSPTALLVASFLNARTKTSSGSPALIR
jgi:hypothetical protein